MLTSLQRIITPRHVDQDAVRPLYFDESGQSCQVLSRRSVRVPSGARVSFASYFNAFPASYWQRWTCLREVTLRMSVSGTGRINVYRSTATGGVVHMCERPVHGVGTWCEVLIPVDLDAFADGGWVWFEAEATDHQLDIEDADWATERPLSTASLAIGMTTMRPADCVAALEALGEDPTVLDLVDTVFVVDQGSTKVRDQERFSGAAAALDGRLQVIEQDNLGGSGGFARVMIEALTHTTATAITLMDDDIVLEPDSLLRAAMFHAAATRPVIVGSHMFDLNRPTRLLATAEVVDLDTCLWRPAPLAVTGHDFAAASLRTTPALHRYVDAGYNGWWTCTIPREVAEQTGLPLPLFIKWDDAEFSLRAATRGFPTVSLPTSAVWHVAWTDKNDATDWQAYFHTRNRLITAALHSPGSVRRTFLATDWKHTVRHLLCMEYSTVELQQLGIEDFLAGPGGLFASLRTALPRAQRIRSRFLDATTTSAAGLTVSARVPARPRNPLSAAARFARAAVRQLVRPPVSDAGGPALVVAAEEARWYTFAAVDSAAVISGTRATVRHRDPAACRRLLARAIRNHWRLRREWPALARRYRAALPDLTSMESWRATLTGDPAELQGERVTSGPQQGY